MSAALSSLLQNVTIEVEVAGAPPVTVSLGGGEPSPLVKALRPAVTIRANGTQLARFAPHGEPSQGFPVVPVVGVGAALVLAVLTWLALRGLSK